MYAIFEDGSHQYRVREGDTIVVDRRDGENGAAKRSSLISVGSSLPIHFTEYGGLETMASKGRSSAKCGSSKVLPSWMLNLS